MPDNAYPTRARPSQSNGLYTRSTVVYNCSYLSSVLHDPPCSAHKVTAFCNAPQTPASRNRERRHRVLCASLRLALPSIDYERRHNRTRRQGVCGLVVATHTLFRKRALLCGKACKLLTRLGIQTSQAANGDTSSRMHEAGRDWATVHNMRDMRTPLRHSAARCTALRATARPHHSARARWQEDLCDQSAKLTVCHAFERLSPPGGGAADKMATRSALPVGPELR